MEISNGENPYVIHYPNEQASHLHNVDCPGTFIILIGHSNTLKHFQSLKFIDNLPSQNNDYIDLMLFVMIITIMMQKVSKPKRSYCISCIMILNVLHLMLSPPPTCLKRPSYTLSFLGDILSVWSLCIIFEL